MPTMTGTPFCLRRYQAGTGWAAPLPSTLDGPSTLVLAFGSSRLSPLDHAFNDLAADRVAKSRYRSWNQ